MRITYISTLDDAFYYLNQAKGRPEIPSLRPLIQRYLRSCILLSWIALEEILEYGYDGLLKKGISLGCKRNLRDKIRSFVEYRCANSFDDKRFTKMRDMRNRLTHPKNNTKEDETLTIEVALQSFEYCYELIRIIYPDANVTLNN
jgi:hypothetical protein